MQKKNTEIIFDILLLLYIPTSFLEIDMCTYLVTLY